MRDPINGAWAIAQVSRLEAQNAELLRALVRAEDWLTEMDRVFPGEVAIDVLPDLRAVIAQTIETRKAGAA